MMVESTVSIPYLLTPVMCMVATDPARGSIASTIIFVSGIVTLMQTTFGVRLDVDGCDGVNEWSMSREAWMDGVGERWVGIICVFENDIEVVKGDSWA